MLRRPLDRLGGLAQQTALGASGLAQTPVSPTSWPWTDSAARGGGFHGPSRAGPREVLGQAHPRVSPAAAGPSSRDSSVCGERTLPLSPPGVYVCPAGWLFSAVAICLQADFFFCNKDYFLIVGGCGLLCFLLGGEGPQEQAGRAPKVCGLDYPKVWVQM